MPRPSTIDLDRVRALAGQHLPASVAAERLGCTPRHYRRLCDRLGLRTYRDPNPLVGTDREWMLWDIDRRAGLSYRRIAYRYGLSHEHVRSVLTTPRQPSPYS